MAHLQHRILSLDVFRGITVAAMILVNNPGSWSHIYAPLEHASWNGCTPTDLIFPFFIFIVGVAIVFAFRRKKADPDSHQDLILRAGKRALILFGLGLFMSLFPYFDFSTVRILGVLQRIGIVYFVSAILFLKTDFKTQGFIFFSLLIAYWLIMTLIPVPGFGPANLQPETNLAAWLDRLILTESHTWKSTKTWDPEGILSTLPAICTGISGLLTGQWISGISYKEKRSEQSLIAILATAGFISAMAGLAWGTFFPINKSLWTSSYVLFSSGCAMMFFSFLYFIIDIRKQANWTTPFVVYGINAITVFFLSGIIARLMNIIQVSHEGEKISLKGFLYQSYFEPNFSALNASLAWAISFVLVWMLILYLMYRKNIIIKV